MGLYDNIHTGTRCGQTKAFGKGLNNITIGDSVTIQQDPMRLLADDYPSHHDGQVATTGVGGGWLIVRDGIWTDWVDDPVDDLDCFDSAGRPVPHGARRGDRADADTSPSVDCVYCGALRALEEL